MANKDEQLIGIKAIADYLEMSPRNVYYWEKKLGLPIHRIASGTGHRIYASKKELDRWLKKQEMAALSGKRYWLIALAAAVLSLAFLLIGFFLLRPSFRPYKSSGPEVVDVEGTTVFVKDTSGKIIFRFNSQKIRDASDAMLIMDITDIDKDGRKELAACTHDIVENEHFVTLFDNDGRKLWKRSVTSPLLFNNTEIKNFFRPGPVKFARSKSGEIFAVSKWNHQERFLSIIACHDLNGNLRNQYFHIGHLTSTLELTDLDEDGSDEIVFTGTNNLLNGEGIIGVLSVDDFHGISPPYRIEPEYSHLETRLKNYIADDIERGNQLVYLRIKTTGYASEYNLIYNNTEIRYSSQNLFHIRLFPWRLVPENLRLGLDFIFDKDFRLKNVLATPYTKKNYHRIFENEAARVPLNDLINVYKNSVFRWENNGWTKLEITP